MGIGRRIRSAGGRREGGLDRRHVPRPHERSVLTRSFRLCFLGFVLCSVVMANIIPTGTTITGTGPFELLCDPQLFNDQNVNSGTAPAHLETIADNVGNAQDPSVVPEPATFILIGGGLVGLGLLGRKKLTRR